MAKNNLIKNRYYIITKDEKPYAYLSVKKDFYTEGYLIDNKAILSGYFTFYETFNAFILDNSMQNFEHYLDGISVSAKDRKNYFDVDGKIILSDYTLYAAKMDEYLYVDEKNELFSNVQIKLIEDAGIINDINYLIRNGIRNLNSVYKFYYDVLKNHRYGNLKELIQDCSKDIFIDSDGTKISDEAIKDLKVYLKTLSYDNEENEKEPQKKLRKKNKRK